ncbi:MAG: hypothetical protein NTW65_11800 [Deltaproteobacteria bacterium]|nr:hypothetical protein [Deltaproteobacteria bacterium]
MKKLPVFVLLILPAILFITAMLLHHAHGPYWISYNNDPEYPYLISSLVLAESKQMILSDHPGATLQLLGAATLKISHALNFSAKDNLEFAVLKNPEFYLTVLNMVLITFNTLLLCIIGLATFILTKNIWLSLLLQFSPFLSNAMLTQGLPRISCEPLLLFSSLLLVLILVMMVVSESFPKSVHWYLITLALVSGFGIATKVTFIPLLIIPLFVLPRLRNKIGFLFLTGLSVILWTWPIISQYERIYRWFYLIFTHTGHYGFGKSGIIDIGVYFQNLLYLFGGNPLFFLIWFVALGFIFRFGLFSATRKIAWQDISFRVLAAVVVAQLCAVMMIAKHSSDYYLLPALSLSGFVLFLMFLYLQRINYFNRFDTKNIVFFIGIFFIFSSVWRIVDIKNVFIQNMTIKQESLAVHLKAESEYKNYLKIFLIRASSPLSALAFGNYYTKALHSDSALAFGNYFTKALHSEVLRKIYGEAYFYDTINGEFHTWTKVFLIEDVISKGYGDRIIFQGKLFEKNGDKLVCNTGSILQLRDVLRGEYETIYTLQGITIPKGSPFQPTS